MFFASALLALLPSVAHGVKDSPVVYGVLLGCFGAGAVLGALLLQPARARIYRPKEWSQAGLSSLV